MKKNIEPMLPEERIAFADDAMHIAHKSHKSRLLTGLGVIILAGLLCVGSLYLLRDTIKVGAASAANTYSTEKEKVAEEAYQKFYQSSYEISEAQHHVSNIISITIGSLREETKLEVLKVSEVEYEIHDEDDGKLITNIKNKVTKKINGEVISWLEIPGYGVFTVDLQAAEYIIDDERQYVLVRVPDPELSEFTLDYANVELLHFEESGMFKGSAAYGEELARKELQSAELSMRQEVNSNQEFYQSARKNTETLLTNLIKQLNPAITDLVVEIEFME